MCSLNRHGNICILTLLGDGQHRLNPAFMDTIISALQSLPHSDASALITTNQGKFFSNGLDLDWLSVDPDSRSLPLGTFFSRLLLTVLNLKMPTIAAVCGHASAGGFIFALAHDYIFMRKDKGFLYMSEIDVGVHIPAAPMAIIRYKMQPLAFRRTVLGGEKLTAGMAVSLGIVDSAHENSVETLDAAKKHAVKIVRRNWKGAFYQKMRSAMYPNLIEELEQALSRKEVPKIVPFAKL